MRIEGIIVNVLNENKIKNDNLKHTAWSHKNNATFSYPTITACKAESVLSTSVLIHYRQLLLQYSCYSRGIVDNTMGHCCTMVHIE